MSGNRVIVIGASAGGVETLKQLVRTLPADFPAPIFIVVHIPAQSTSVLPTILTRAGILPAIHPRDEQKIENGHIYIAPPDKHLLVKQGYLMLTRGPRENGHRPSVDPLFRSAARHYGRRVIGVVLTGALDDGTAGLSVIKSQGGVAIVQDPEDAIYPGMPQSAIEHVEVDYVLRVSEMAALLTRLASEEVKEIDTLVSDKLKHETNLAELKMSAIEDEDRPGTPSTFVCPECGGTLWEITEGDVLRFRCHVGHAYTSETFLSEQNEKLEAALWIALRALEDSASLRHRLADRARGHEHKRAEARFKEEAQNVEEHARIVRNVLLNGVWGDKSAVVETDKDVIDSENEPANSET